MAGNLAFTGQGSGIQPGVLSPSIVNSLSTVSNGGKTGIGTSITGTTPAFANKSTSPNIIPGSNNVVDSNNPVNTKTTYSNVAPGYVAPAQPTTPLAGLIQSVKPTTAPKQISTGADGSQTVTYHAPTADKTQGGLLSLATPTTDPTQAQTPTTSATQTSSPSGSPTTFPGIVGGIVDAANGNTAIADKANQITQKYSDIINPALKEARGQEIGNMTTGLFPVGQGIASDIAQATGTYLQGITGQEQQELSGNNQGLTAQSQKQSGLNQAGNLAAPVNVTPGNALVNPQTGTEQYSGLGGLTGLGIAQQNIAQGKAYQQQAADLSTTLGQIDQLTPTLTNFLNTSGLNQQGTPFYNQSIKSYIGSVKDPSAVASLNTMLADLKTYTAQVLGASGLNPTEVSSTVNSFDPSNLNAEQMTAFVSNLRNLGQIRLKPLQDSAAASYSSGTTPYVGDSANPSVNSASAEQNNSTATSVVGNSDLGQGLAGLGINALGGLEGVMSTIAGTAAKILGA